MKRLFLASLSLLTTMISLHASTRFEPACQQALNNLKNELSNKKSLAQSMRFRTTGFNVFDAEIANLEAQVLKLEQACAACQEIKNIEQELLKKQTALEVAKQTMILQNIQVDYPAYLQEIENLKTRKKQLEQICIQSLK